ncbi:MAG: ATP-binding protein [Burkholderiales bacterium]|nr:ATP-binding protein [Burkholderiales bacterium]
MTISTPDLELPPLPLGESDFSALREVGEIYVDKTEMVFELAKNKSKAFLTRPRRFGKTLLISTLFSLFKYGLRDFSGLAIEKLWKDEKKYFVISLNFARISGYLDILDFRDQFNLYLLNSLQLNGYVPSNLSSSSINALLEFAKWLGSCPNNSVVLLIDEYDAPLTSCFNDAETFHKVGAFMTSFYSCIKDYSGVFRFLFLTGITKFGNAGIFSQLNSLSDISLSPRFGTIVGYTLEELKKYFGGYLRNAGKSIGLPESKLIEELVANYNGFCFELTAKKKVFSPWSILSFLNDPECGLINYWFESGGQPSVLMQYVKGHTLTHPFQFDEGKTIKRTELSSSVSSNKIEEKVLLVQTGYLTIKSRTGDDILGLGYPNREVANSIASIGLDRLLEGRTLADVKAGEIPRFLAEGNVEEFVGRINNAFLALDYKRYFIRDEKSCQGALLLVLYGSGLQAQVETHNAHGRSDIEFTIAGARWVIELKYAREEKEILKELNEGLNQMVTRHYGEQTMGTKLIRLAMVYSEKDRCFVNYQVAK